MYVVSDIATLRQKVSEWRRLNEKVALVPTMGNLHAGHLRLIEHAQTLAPHTVVSLFVNPMQFDRKDDLEAYPRTFDADRQALEAMNIDLLFNPDSSVIYPQSIESMTRVEVPGLSNILCGANRPGHFTGVATVVTKLFNLVTADQAVFGTKDYQQLQIIKKLVTDLDIDIEIHSVATVREQDGLAMSSRNRYLTADERRLAPTLYQTLQKVAATIQLNSQNFSEIESEAEQMLIAAGLRPDYVSIRDAVSLQIPGDNTARLVVLAAAWLGQARLIDNILL